MNPLTKPKEKKMNIPYYGGGWIGFFIPIAIVIILIILTLFGVVK